MAFNKPVSVARFVAAILLAPFVGATALIIPLARDRTSDADGAMSMFVVFIAFPAAVVYLALSLPLVARLYWKRNLTLGGLLGVGALAAFVVGLVVGAGVGDVGDAAVLGVVASLSALAMWLAFWLIADTSQLGSKPASKTPGRTLTD
jgi:hypothetical protein